MCIDLVVVCSFVIIRAFDQKLRKLPVDFREILAVVVVVVIEPVNTANNHYMLPWSLPPSRSHRPCTLFGAYAQAQYHSRRWSRHDNEPLAKLLAIKPKCKKLALSRMPHFEVHEAVHVLYLIVFAHTWRLGAACTKRWADEYQLHGGFICSCSSVQCAFVDRNEDLCSIVVRRSLQQCRACGLLLIGLDMVQKSSWRVIEFPVRGYSKREGETDRQHNNNNIRDRMFVLELIVGNCPNRKEGN